jgi:hypothetical protein
MPGTREAVQRHERGAVIVGKCRPGVPERQGRQGLQARRVAPSTFPASGRNERGEWSRERPERAAVLESPRPRQGFEGLEGQEARAVRGARCGRS